jgi:hypothetical protein
MFSQCGLEAYENTLRKQRLLWFPSGSRSKVGDEPRLIRCNSIVEEHASCAHPFQVSEHPFDELPQMRSVSFRVLPDSWAETKITFET